MIGTRFASQTMTLARKDLVVEARGRDTLLPMLVFALSVTVMLAFTLPDPSNAATAVDLPVGAVALADVVAGFLWITVLFAGLIGFARTFEAEREEGALDALLLLPLDRSGLFAAKAAANLVGLVVIEIVTLPLYALLFDLRLGRNWPSLVLVVVLVDIGFVAVGTLFSSVAAQTRSRELVLPVLALPALVPVLIAAVELTSAILAESARGEAGAGAWFGILVAYDVVACVVGALTFEFALD
jgi:heme exporter protein B